MFMLLPTRTATAMAFLFLSPLPFLATAILSWPAFLHCSGRLPWGWVWIFLLDLFQSAGKLIVQFFSDIICPEIIHFRGNSELAG